jgi:cytochrome c553
MKKIAIAMLFAGSTLLMADGAALFAKCAGCHGQKGEKAALGKSAIIAGQDAAKTVEQLKGYKAGTLSQYSMGALMKGQVASMSDDDIKAVADYIAGLK